MLNNTSDFSDLFDDPEVRTAISPPFASVDELLPQERFIVEGAMEKRQREFATARVIAHQLFADFGIYRYPLLNDDDRVPIWPTNLIGSISHCNDCCLVAVLRKNNGSINIGVDVEPDDPLDANLWPGIATGHELRWIKSQNNFNSGRLAHLLFSAKEAVYKCIFPITRKFIEFHDVEIECDLNTDVFYATIHDLEVTEIVGSATLSGRFQRTNGFIFTSCSLRQTESFTKGEACKKKHC